MLLFAKKKSSGADEMEAAAPPPPPPRITQVPDFIPYFCHFNPHTLLTKNGELVQVIRILSNTEGLDYESGDGIHTVREAVRRAIMETLPSDCFSLWIHTVRKRRPIRYEGKYQDPFPTYLHETWQKLHPWKYQYYNELYVTVLHDGQGSAMMNKKHLRDTALQRPNRAWRNAYLDNALGSLDGAVGELLAKIRGHYNAHRLSVVERVSVPSPGAQPQAVFYSEPMEFLGTLLNLRQEAFPVTETDIGQALHTHGLTFGYNALESKAASGHRRFAALLTLKAYREVPPETSDRVLQAPIELVVSEAFHFVPHTAALKEYREQKTLFDISGDDYSGKASGLEEMLSSNRKSITDFGRHQTSIMVIVDDYRQLDEEAAKVQSAFSELGLIAIREDIKLEDCFWSQMPGNFVFLRRQEAINTSRIAGFCRLNRFPGGMPSGNHWGDAVALIPTVVNSPYFFNFHLHDNGHTLLFDFNSFGDEAGRVGLSFLLASALKFQGRMFLFDRGQSARLFFDKLGAPYRTLGYRQKKQPLHLNPFSLEDSQHNRSFLLAWCMALVDGALPLDESHRDVLGRAIEQLFSGPGERRNLGGLVALLEPVDAMLAQAFSTYAGGGEWSGAFDAAADTLHMASAVQAFDLTQAFTHKPGAVALFSYLLHRIITSIDGKPTLIVVHEAWDLIDNDFFAPRLESLLEMLKQNNVMVVFTTANPQGVTGTRIFSTLMQQCATHLYVPDDIKLDYESAELGLTENDNRLLHRMERRKGDMLVRQGGESVGLRIDMSEMDDIRAVFANDIKNLIAAGGKFAGMPSEG